MTGFGLGLWSPPEVVLKKRCRRLFKQQRLSWRAVPIGAERGGRDSLPVAAA